MKRKSISEYIAEFKKTKNPLALMKAIMLVFAQGKIDEVVYGLFCALFHKPSKVIDPIGGETEECMEMVRKADALYKAGSFFTRDQLIKFFGDKFNVSALPKGFTGSRTEGIVQIKNLLILGDYGTTQTSATIAIISKEKCVLNNFYNELPGVLHIHSIHIFNSSELVISTGDTKKLTDLWTVEHDDIKFKRRIKRNLAGYTAAKKFNGEHFFGTDFSGRPNFIVTLDGKKYFFPHKAYRMYVDAFYPFGDRYIVSINMSLACLGNQKAMSIFDSVKKQFIFCEYYDLRDGGQAARAIRAKSTTGEPFVGTPYLGQKLLADK